MYKQNRILVDLLQPLIAKMGYEMLGIEEAAQGRHSLLRIYIDKESGITLDDCARVSAQVTGILDVEDPIHGPYHLEISSPGLDRPLFNLGQFERFVGRRAQVRLRAKLEGRRKIMGRIVAIRGETVVLEEDEVCYEVPAELIDRARLLTEL